MHTVVLGYGPGHKLGGSGLDTYLGEQHAAGILRSALILLDHPCHVGDFARDVEIVRAILGARFEGLENVSLMAVVSVARKLTCMFPIQPVWPHRRDQDKGLLGQRTQIVIIQLTYLDVCQTRSVTGSRASAATGGPLTRLSAVWIQRPDLRCKLLKLAAGATSNRPLEIGGQVCGDMLGCVFASISYSP